jgi:cytochrome d ubiquinol oxidase subunit I
MRTADAVSPVSTQQVAFSFISIMLIYLLLGAVGIFLVIKFARRGPAPADKDQAAGG